MRSHARAIDQLRRSAFAPMPQPGPDDWLGMHPEPGQSFEDWLAGDPPLPSAERCTLALVPIGDVREGAPTKRLSAYAGAFFAMPVRLLPSISIGSTGARTRTNPFTHARQLRAPDVLDFLRSIVPDDAFALCGFTDEDLYPEESWNFVFGQASLRERVGVISFARYDPAFVGERRGPGDERILLRRSMNVLVHETGHMFGLAHCVYYACIMNGSNHLAETDARPFHACPVCLRKLQHAIGFDARARYAALAQVYAESGFDEEARWARARMAEIDESR